MADAIARKAYTSSARVDESRGRQQMWEGILFAMQITAVWILIHWLLTDERAGGRAEAGLFALRRKRDPAPAQRRGRMRGTRASERPRL